MGSLGLPSHALSGMVAWLAGVLWLAVCVCFAAFPGSDVRKTSRLEMFSAGLLLREKQRLADVFYKTRVQKTTFYCAEDHVLQSSLRATCAKHSF